MPCSIGVLVVYDILIELPFFVGQLFLMLLLELFFFFLEACPNVGFNLLKDFVQEIICFFSVVIKRVVLEGLVMKCLHLLLDVLFVISVFAK